MSSVVFMVSQITRKPDSRPMPCTERWRLFPGGLPRASIRDEVTAKTAKPAKNDSGAAREALRASDPIFAGLIDRTTRPGRPDRVALALGARSISGPRPIGRRSADRRTRGGGDLRSVAGVDRRSRSGDRDCRGDRRRAASGRPVGRESRLVARPRRANARRPAGARSDRGPLGRRGHNPADSRARHRNSWTAEIFLLAQLGRLQTSCPRATSAFGTLSRCCTGSRRCRPSARSASAAMPGAPIDRWRRRTSIGRWQPEGEAPQGFFSTEMMLPAGSVNQAMSGPWRLSMPRATPFASVKPS